MVMNATKVSEKYSNMKTLRMARKPDALADKEGL